MRKFNYLSRISKYDHGKKISYKKKNCPQNQYRKQMGLISRANLRKKHSFSRLELANKVVELESKIEDYERFKNFGCVDCVHRNLTKIHAETHLQQSLLLLLLLLLLNIYYKI